LKKNKAILKYLTKFEIILLALIQNNSLFKFSVLSNIQSQLDEILYHGLRPWLDSNKSYEKFTPLITKVKSVNLDFDPLYEFDFNRPLNSKSKFYYNLIINETNKYCNNAFVLITENDNILYQTRMFDDILKIELPKLLTDIIEVIKKNHFFLEYIDPRKVNFEVNPEHKTDSYIMQLLKVAFVKIYLEIQEEFKLLSKELPISERDIYDRYFNQGLPENSFLKRTLPKVENHIETQDTESSSIKVSGVSRHSFTYKKFNSDSDKLSDLFKFMKENGLILKENLLASFKRVFSGKEVSNPVIWSGSTNEFHYFVYLIHSKYELVEPIKRNFWKVACKCFLKGDGTLFNSQTIKEGSKPKNTAEILEQAVELIK
jgi:hypothetical protein